MVAEFAFLQVRELVSKKIGYREAPFETVTTYSIVEGSEGEADQVTVSIQILGALKAMESYRIDLETILRILSRKSGEIQAVVKNIPGSKEQGTARITLVKGKITACVLEGVYGTLFSGEQAFRILQSVGELNWIYTHSDIRPSPPDATRLLPSPSVERSPTRRSTIVPVRQRLVGLKELASWPHWKRQVYKLTDGRNTSEEIAAMLNCPPEYVMQILTILQKDGIISLPS